ncbi:disease resistance protein RGA2-like [Eucalyptus grandis]|uniref:disease resistance protein RGA2-like n=1 Tax=Eucalyptus grandis TaxID=71139 RepID=UPI00192EB028|nr:disease resistance protein RGA2-like [Eucalyptus grandis]
MAEAVLFSLATDILKNLATEMVKPGGSFASQKIQLLCCAKDELQNLEDTVETIKAVLLDAEKKQWHSQLVKHWLKKLKEVLYDVQDLLDDVATQDLRRKVTPGSKMSKEVRLFFSKSNQLAHGLKVGNEIEELRKKLVSIKNIGDFSLEKQDSEATLRTERRTPTFERDENIIGREKDKEEIIACLLDSSSGESVSVVSIIAIGGMGKTTLADLVYKDEKVKECFELRMWVCHGDPKNFDVDFIVKKILNSAKADPEVKKNLEDIENKSAEELHRLLRKVLDGKKYLLVLDDLWNEDRMRWLKLRPLLMGGSRGSKILITTRSLSVVEATDAKSIKYNLCGLSAEKSWDLFKKLAFGDAETSIDSGLEEIRRAIVKNCAGVPLAIKTIGSLLYTKKKTEWFNFKERELSYINDSAEGIMEVLKVSYDHLPSHLKHCFAYCALFPKDYVFDKQTMIQLWMAQGFIESSEGNDDLEDTGDNYVSNLLCRSFLEVEEIDDDTGEVNTFKMHDLMHDLALKVAGDECKMIDLNEGGINRGIRHASFLEQSSSRQKVTLLREATNLRTFISLKEGQIIPTDFPIEIISKLRCCRALGFGYDYFLIPTFLGSRLKHLRFLDASDNYSIQNLPDSITDLVNLQTLKLSNCKKLTTLPRDLKKLVNLRHLLIDGCKSLSHMPCGLSHLSKLQTLNLYVVQKMDHKVPGGVGSLDELSALNRLGGSIVLKNLKFLQPVPNKGHLQEKERLRCLKLDWRMDEQDGKSDSDELILWENLRPHLNLTSLTIYSYRNRSSPSWLSSMANLIELYIDGCEEWKYLPSLRELPSLRRLTLGNLYALEFVEEISDLEQSDTSPPYLPSLENLNLYYCDNLKGWWGRSQPMELDQDHQQYNSYSSFPKLLSMKIWDCPHLNSMPLFPQIESLEIFAHSIKWLQQRMAVSTFIPLSKLERLEFQVVHVEHSMLETLLPFLRNLKTLVFDHCNELRSLSCGMQSLSSLQSLDIRECEELDVSSHDDEHGTQWRSLAKLRHLTFYRLPKLVALPEGIQHITTLESLNVSRCKNLMSLPEWIGNFSALKKLDVSDCSKLTCLPDGISRLTSLKTLRIAGCPVLQERCQRECGADWEKIAHLPCSREEIIEEW